MNKPSLVLLPGLLSDERVWEHQINNLKDKASIQVITFPSEDTPEKMVRKILKEAGETFVLAGHSMGGWLALEVLRHAPERVKKLCLLNTTARGDTLEKLARRQEMIQSKNFEKIARELADKFVWKESAKKRVLEMFLEVGQKTFISQQQAMIQREECVSLLADILVPTVVVHAEHDENFSQEMLEELARKIPNAKLKLVKNSGHMSPMEAPEAITEVLLEQL